MRPRTVFVVAVASTLAVAGCGARTLETSDASRKISEKITQQQPELRGVAIDCPTSVKAEKGTNFTCTVTADGGFTGTVEVSQTDDRGTLSIRYPAPPGTGPRPTVIASPGSVPATALIPPGTTPEQCGDATPGEGELAADQSKIILFSKTEGFRHESIPKAIETLKTALQDRGFTVDATEDASVFTNEGLNGVSAVVFVDTTGDVVNDEQQSAIEQYVRKGGGWAGVHSATDTEYDWPFYETLAGARFAQHPPELQDAAVVVEDKQHPSTVGLPERWTRKDEWYDFKASPRSCVHVLANLDEASYSGGQMGPDHPIMWCKDVGKGRSWYTAMGHTDESWADDAFKGNVIEGIVSVTPTVPKSC